MKRAIQYTMPEKGRPVQSRRPRPEPERIDVAALYEDEWLLAVDKPPGMVVHPTYRNWSGTLLNGLLWRFRDRPAIEPRIVTRLDKDTSGLVVVALNADVHARIQQDAAKGRIVKEYLAVVHGRPDPRRGAIALPLARSAADRRRVVVDPCGQESETRYEVLSEGPVSVVRCELITGRTHQIRVHLAARGWPILGDRVYGTPDGTLPRQALHAWRVSLPHPVSRDPVALEAPVPDDLRRFFP
ncbi:MAG: RluA family pseudouridine synthase [Acidobacteria bacterium]|nr:RluA family pseudouridine synthase [Acidobacteriota bacterium]